MNRGLHKHRGIKRNSPSHFFWKSLGNTPHLILNCLCGSNRIGTRHLINGYATCRLVINLEELTVVLATHFYSGDITQVRDFSLIASLNNNSAELLGGCHSTGDIERQLKILTHRCGRSTNLTCS